MDHRIPKVGGVISVLLALGALITFVFLNKKFEGPDPTAFLGSPYELTASFDNTKTLPTKQPVLHKGVSVGRVTAVDYDPETREGVVSFTLEDPVDPIYADAKLAIGERSLLGDAYLNLLDRGTPGAGELEAGDEVTETMPSVNFDEALDFLDREGRARTRSVLNTIARGVGPEGNGAQLNGTTAGIARTISELRSLTDALRGQEQDIAALVSDSATVLDVLSSREDAVRTIVASGRVTLDALAANTASLDQALVELPLVLESGRRTLAAARPLLFEARPVVAQLRALAPKLTPAFREGAPFAIGPLSADLVDIIEGLAPQRRASEQVMPRLTRLNRISLPLVRLTGPATLNTVPVADYLAPRTKSLGAFYTHGSSVIAHRDSVGRYARFGTILDPGLGSDMPVDGQCDPSTGVPTVPGPGFCYNAYPEPGDARDNRPFVAPYPRLRAYRPPDPDSLRSRGR